MGKTYFRARPSLDGSAISGVGYHLRIPGYLCDSCGVASITTRFGFPQIDLIEWLTQSERELLNPNVAAKPENAHIIADLASRIRKHFGINAAPGSHFGPMTIKVTQKPKFDFDVLPFFPAVFAKRVAVEKIANKGFKLNHVNPVAYGKNVELADYVQLCIPVSGHAPARDCVKYCNICKRLKVSTASDYSLALDYSRLPGDDSIFFVEETGFVAFSSEFVECAKMLGISGFDKWKDLFEIAAI